MNRISKASISQKRRTLRVESLEQRNLFAGDLTHCDSSSDSSHHSDSGHIATPKTGVPNASSSSVATELKAEFRNPSGAKVEFEIEKSRLEISIEKAMPMTSYQVTLGESVVATLVTDARGKASVKTSATGAAATAIAGDLVSVKGIGSGTLKVHGHQLNADNHLASTKLKASLAGLGTGKAELEKEGGRQKFEVEARGLSANTTYDITIDGVVVGKISTNSRGKGELKFDNSKGRTFPANFPVITSSSVISIGSVSSGTFASSMSDRHY